jgi:hypothetical protein
MRYLTIVLRYLLGIVFFVFGLNGFLQFIPLPPYPGPAGAFLGALAATGYLFPLLKTIEVVGGALLLGNRFVPLALTLLAPALVNIVLFHTVLAPASPLVFIMLFAEIYLAWAYRDAFRPMLAARVNPATAAPAGSEPVAARAAA